MSTIKTVSGTGFTKDEAFGKKANYDVKFNATVAWKKAGQPKGAELKAFADAFLAKKVKSAAGIGAYIVETAGVVDSRERPYTTEVVATEGKRKYKAHYQIVNKETKAIVGGADKKSEAIALGKKIVTKDKISVSIDLTKIVSEGQATAATIDYTPSINAKQGSFIFFGIETEQ